MDSSRRAAMHDAAFADRFAWTPPEPAPHLRALFRELMRQISDGRSLVVLVSPRHGMSALRATLGKPRTANGKKQQPGKGKR